MPLYKKSKDTAPAPQPIQVEPQTSKKRTRTKTVRLSEPPTMVREAKYVEPMVYKDPDFEMKKQLYQSLFPGREYCMQ